MSAYLLAGVIFLLCLYSWIRKVNAYEAFISGVKDGFSLFYNVFPTMLAMIFCVNLIQASGIFDAVAKFLKPLIPQIDPRIIPMILFRPISGSASLAVMIHLFESTGVNSLVSKMASVIQGSTDTTFYVISLYFSSVGIKRIRHVVPVSLLADILAMALAITFTLKFFIS